MKRKVLVSIAVGLAVSQIVDGQTTAGVGRTAVVVSFADGSKLPMKTLTIYGASHSPTFYFSGGGWQTDIGGIPIRQDRFWKIVPLSEIKSATFANTEGKFELTNGNVETGYVPRNPTEETWLSGYTFMLAGKKKVLGTMGDYAVELGTVAQIARNNEKKEDYNITEKDGKLATVSELKLVAKGSSGGACRSSFTYPGASMEITIDKTTVSLRLGDIASLLFTKGTGDGIKVRMRSGEESSGTLKDSSDCDYVFGTTTNDATLFTPVRVAHKETEPDRSVQGIEFISEATTTPRTVP